MIKSKPAKTTHYVLPVIANRWSPVIFSQKPVDEEKIMSLLEAARWAPSSYNEQPWQYIIGYKGDDNYNQLAETLAEGNSWAKTAPVLMCSLANKNFSYNNKPNYHYMHDVGMATMALVLQATEMGLVTHQMAGFDLKKVKKSFKLPANIVPGSLIAIGYSGEFEKAPLEMRKRDLAPRSRKDMEKLIY